MAGPSPDNPAGRTSRELMRDRNFGPYVVGNLLSNCGTWFQNIAAAVVVYQLTGSAFMVGLVSVLQFGPVLLVGLWAGALSDRFDRRRLLIGSQFVACSASAALAIWTALVGVHGLPGPWPIFATAGVLGLAFSFSVPSMQALVPSLVDDEDLRQAVALNSVTFNLARAVGPALGGVTIAVFGAATAFAVNAVSYLPLIVALFIVRALRAQDQRTDASYSVPEGLRFVISDPILVVMLVCVMALGFGSDPINTLTPALAEMYGYGAGMVGAMASAFGIGSASVIPLLSWLSRRIGLPRCGLLGLGVLAFGMYGLALSPNPATALLSLVVGGAGFLLALTSMTTRIHRRVPDHLRGRVMAVWGVAFLGSRPFAAALHGAVADVVSPQVGVATAASIVAVAAMVAWRVQHPVPGPIGAAAVTPLGRSRDDD